MRLVIVLYCFLLLVSLPLLAKGAEGAERAGVAADGTVVIETEPDAARGEVPDQEQGKYLMQHFDLTSYGAYQYFRNFTQDAQGNIYAASGNGIYRYNGSNWFLLSGTQHLNVAVMMIDDTGKLLVGGSSYFGYLTANAQGHYRLQALQMLLPDGDSYSGLVNQIMLRPEGVYFAAKNEIWLWDKQQQLSMIKPGKTWFYRMHAVNDKLIVEERHVGLFELHHGRLTKLAGGAFFAENAVSKLFSFDKETLLVATAYNGLHVFDGKNFTPLASTADPYFSGNWLYESVRLKNGQLALIIQGDKPGLLLLDPRGQLLRFLTRADGLTSDMMFALFEDHQRGLWLAVGDMLTRIETDTSLSVFDQQQQLQGFVYSMVRYKHRFYVSTVSGIYRLQPSLHNSAQFSLVSGVLGECQQLTVVNGQLLAACFSNLYRIDGLKATPLLEGRQSLYRLLELPDNGMGTRLLLGHQKGLALATHQHGQWQYERLAADDFSFEVVEMALGEPGHYWVANVLNGVIELDFSRGFGVKPVISYFAQAHGLPHGWVIPRRVDGRLVFSTDKGLYRFNPNRRGKADTFTLATGFGNLGRQKLRLEESNGEVFVRRYVESVGQLNENTTQTRLAFGERLADNRFRWDFSRFVRLSSSPITQVFAENNGFMWLKTGNKLLRFDRNRPQAVRQVLPPFIDSVSPLHSDRLLHRGGGHRGGKPNDGGPLTLAYRDNSLRFDFAFPAFDEAQKNRFQYRLAGFDQQWSDWSSESHKDYTTIAAGDYRFELRAKNVYGDIATAKAFDFVVLPPWYRSWWAYALYLLLGLTAMLILLQLRTRSLRRQALALEQTVAERTATVSHLLEQKSRLFASISHEFRTPLTLILSPLESLLTQFKHQPVSEDLGLIKRNARRLLRMVDQLLEFAKLEQQQEVTPERVSLAQSLGLIVASFEHLVEAKNITLTVSPFADVMLTVLPDSLNKMLINLLSNALKYTPQGGRIEVLVNADAEALELVVKDNGIGIAPGDHQAVFKRFNRATHNHGEAVPGAGIGLALVKELAQANQGDISLSSALGKGATFTLSLPLKPADQHDLATGEPASAAAAVQLPPRMDETQAEARALEVDSVTFSDTQSTQPGLSATTMNDTDSGQKSILIIDDNADMRLLLQRQLGPHYRCWAAANGQAGLDIAREQLPDLILSDIMMPVMDGYQLSELLRRDELTSHIPIILLSAKGSVESRIKGLKLLVDDYLAKPFNSEELLLRIDNILTIRALLSKRFGQMFDVVSKNTAKNEPESAHQDTQTHQRQLQRLGLNQADMVFCNKFNAQLEKHYPSAAFNVKTLCLNLGISEKQLQRKLKALLYQGFSELLRSYRLNKAAQLLADGQRGSQIWNVVGFSSHSYFSSCFKAKFDQSPKAYQQGLAGSA